MKYFGQMLVIFAFTALGEVLAAVIPLPIPAAIYGLVLLLTALCTGLLKPAHIADTAHFLVKLLPVLFVAPAVEILAHWGVIAPNIVPIVTILAVSTLVVFAVSGLVTRLLQKKEDRHE